MRNGLLIVIGLLGLAALGCFLAHCHGPDVEAQKESPRVSSADLFAKDIRPSRISEPLEAPPPQPLPSPTEDWRPFSIFDNQGEINPYFAQRYHLSENQIQVLLEAKERAIAELLKLDLKHAVIVTGGDPSLFEGRIPTYKDEGTPVFEGFYKVVEEILGQEYFNDYKVNEYVGPSAKEGFAITYAGLLNKEFTIRKLVGVDGQSSYQAEFSFSLDMIAGPNGKPAPIIKFSSSGAIQSRSDLKKFDPYLEVIAPAWVP